VGTERLVHSLEARHTDGAVRVPSRCRRNPDATARPRRSPSSRPRCA
jgi:hypothetical protein